MDVTLCYTLLEVCIFGPDEYLYYLKKTNPLLNSIDQVNMLNISVNEDSNASVALLLALNVNGKANKEYFVTEASF